MSIIGIVVRATTVIAAICGSTLSHASFTTFSNVITFRQLTHEEQTDQMSFSTISGTGGFLPAEVRRLTNFIPTLDPSHSYLLQSPGGFVIDALPGGTEYQLATVLASAPITLSDLSAMPHPVGGISSVGAYFGVVNAANIGVANVPISLFVTDVSGASATFSLLSSALPTFLGIISTADISSVQISLAASSQNYLTIDDVTLAVTGVPEPGSLALLVVGSVLILRSVHRKKSLQGKKNPEL